MDPGYSVNTEKKKKKTHKAKKRQSDRKLMTGRMKAEARSSPPRKHVKPRLSKLQREPDTVASSHTPHSPSRLGPLAGAAGLRATLGGPSDRDR